MKEPKVSVVVPTYNREDMLRLTLTSLSDQTLPTEDFEVIVADDGSSDGTSDVVRSFDHRLRLKYTFQDDLGFRAAAARNAGARLADAPILVFLDTGVQAAPGLVGGHARAAEHRHTIIGYTYGSQSDTKLTGLAQSMTKLTPQEVRSRFLENWSFHDSRHFLFGPVGFDVNRYAVPWLLLWSLNFSIQSADFWSAGGFDEDFCDWGMEDLELGYRLHKQGTRFTVSRDAWGIEFPHERDRKANQASNSRNIIKFLLKHRDPILELYWAWDLDYYSWSLDDEYEALQEWTRTARNLTVADEIRTALQTLSTGGSAAVFGCGDWRPESPQPHSLFDFDPEYVDRDASQRNARQRAVGIRTPLPDESVDLVVITSRLRGLWESHGSRILAEARRVGRSVWLPPDW
ncbi:glycosyltransferase [Natronosporangium hydrolyticum]|uniref:Glycosyltransferase n=1 Tax=Natronosporangium hydrolyticum TaxID=2811111 RepID=A0A895YK49_9ACTN|nr:glycosyltransferase [Natronosporangium hydrolyticum]QSB16412.1 glycosyltransferase [Natronosporangium hydrolyticum]